MGWILALIALAGAAVGHLPPTAAPDAVAPPGMGASAAQSVPCSLTADACAFAVEVERWVRERDVGALVARLASREYECPGPEPQGSGGPYPLCDSSQAGERRSGHVIGFYQSEGVVISTEEYARTIVHWLSEADAGSVDQFGGGAARVVTVGCPTAGFPGSCGDVLSVVVSFRALLPDFRAPTRFALIFAFEQTPGAGPPRIAYTRFGFTFPAQVYRGGPFQETTYVPWAPTAGTLPPVGTGLTVDRGVGVWTVLAAGTVVMVAGFGAARIGGAGRGPQRSRSGRSGRSP